MAYTTDLPAFQIQRDLLHGEIVTFLRRLIVSGDLRPGERLIETDLAEKFGVSRAPLREALRQLAAEGLVVNHPRRGTSVIELAPHDLWEIYSLRQALESLAVELLVQRLTAEQQYALAALIAEMGSALSRQDFPAVVDLDMRFHESLCRFSGHSRLYSAWLRMGGQLRSFFAAADRLYQDHQIIERHQELLDAIVDGDRQKAVEVVREHISNAADRIRQMSLGGAEPS